MELTKIEVEVPIKMKTYIEVKTEEELLLRNALLLYPFIYNKEISHGKAAEILGISKTNLIDLYSKIGLHYLDMTMDELDKDIETFRTLRSLTG